WGIAAATLTLLGTIVFGSLVDRRARARSAETEALRRSEDRFRSLVVATAQIIWNTDEKGEFAAEQPEWAAFTGCAFEEYRGWRCRGWTRGPGRARGRGGRWPGGRTGARRTCGARAGGWRGWRSSTPTPPRWSSCTGWRSATRRTPAPRTGCRR